MTMKSRPASPAAAESSAGLSTVAMRRVQMQSAAIPGRRVCIVSVPLLLRRIGTGGRHGGSLRVAVADVHRCGVRRDVEWDVLVARAAGFEMRVQNVCAWE